MNKLEKTFAGKKNIPLAYITAGDPTAEKTVECILEMEKCGVGMIILGVPFSDPTAEGAAIQESNIRALAGGMNLFGVFNIMRQLREKSDIPVMLNTYANPIFQYGYDRFFEGCRLCGVDLVNVSDMPYEEKAELMSAANASGIPVLSVVAASTPERIRMIAGEAKGMIRMLTDGDPAKTLALIREVSELPVMVDASCGLDTEGKFLDDSVVRLCGKYGMEAPAALHRLFA